MTVGMAADVFNNNVAKINTMLGNTHQSLPEMEQFDVNCALCSDV